jgi:hypothetical protein
MRFKYWLHLQESIDKNTEDKLLQQKVDAKELNDFINQLKAQPELIDTRSAFAKLQEKFPIQRKEKFSIEAPTDPFFKQYYDQLTKREITKPEYDTLIFFKDNSQGLLTSMMQSLRNLIQERKIELNFINKIPTIVYQKKAIPNKDFTQFTATLHGIEGQNATKPSNNNLADPFFLEVSHKEKLVAKSADGTIWVFKATGPSDCRLMGKGQSWCISSSSSAQWYFNYRHEHGQTQYFIFDFNKDENDPARYVNPGIAPEGKYSEWVDTSNSPDDINGYSSIEEYKDYLKSKGIDIGVFVADPLTEEEKLLKKSSEEYKYGYFSEQDEIFKEFKEGQYKELFDKFIETMSFLNVGLKEKHFNQLSDQQKKLYLSNSGNGLRNLLSYSSNKDELIDQIFPYVKDKLDSEIVIVLLRASSKPDERINQILPYLKDKLDSKMVGSLLRYSSEEDELINKILPYVKDKLDSDMVKKLLHYSENRDEMIDKIFPYVEDKLDLNMLEALLEYSSEPDELIKQIFALVKDKLDSKMVGDLLDVSKNRDELIDQIFPYVKDKLDSDMVYKLLRYSSEPDKLIKQILPYVKDKLDKSNSIVVYLLRYSSEEDELVNQILPYVKNKLDSEMVQIFLRYSKNRDELVNQIFPYVEDKLDSEMVYSLLRYSSEPDELIDKIFPYVEDKLDSEMVYTLLQYSRKSDELINQILPLVKDKLDSIMVYTLTDYSSKPDELRKRIDAIKNSV